MSNVCVAIPPSTIPSPLSLQEESPVVLLRPKAATDETRFARAFHNALIQRLSSGSVLDENRPRGLLLEYLYWKAQDPHAAWGNPNPPLSAPWDTLVSGRDYTAFGSEAKALSYALRSGLAQNLPKTFNYYAYGPGENSAVTNKDILLLKTAQKAGKEITGAATFDQVDIYARSAAARLNEEFNICAFAYNVNLIANGGGAIKNAKARMDTDAPSVVGIFGGFFQNFCDKQVVEQYRKIIDLHGPDVTLVMPINGSTDSKTLLEEYKWSPELEGFILNFFPRAVEEEIIKNKEYDVFSHWQLHEPVYDENRRAVEIFAEAKKPHTLSVDFNRIGEKITSIDIAEGDRLSVSFSRKGPVQDHVDNLKEAGFTLVRPFRQPGTHLHVLQATPK